MSMEYTHRLCADCIHCDIEHRWCHKRECPTPPMVRHPQDKACQYYRELFDAAMDGHFLTEIYADAPPLNVDTLEPWQRDALAL